MRPLDSIEKEFKKKRVPEFEVGDTVDVHVKVLEGDRERIQIFSGIVIAKRHQNLAETFTVRRIVQGEGVERIFPIQSPRLVKVEVKKRGKVRRAKLHYLRGRVGRATRVEERLGGRKEAPAPTPPPPAPEEEPAPEHEAKAPHAKAEPAKKT